MTVYAVVDTNILVSALISKIYDSATVLLLNKLTSGEFTIVYSNDIMKEYKEVLYRDKFSLTKKAIEYVLDSIERYGLLIEPSASGLVIPDMKDLPFYEVVLEKREDGAYLVTGNKKHFPIEPFVVTAREFLDILDNRK